MLRCLFGHKWAPIAIRHYYDTSYSVQGVESSKITFKCSRQGCCGVKTKVLYGAGFLTTDQVFQGDLRARKASMGNP